MSKPRKFYSTEHKFALVTEMKESGKSIDAFARSKGMNPSALRRWAAGKDLSSTSGRISYPQELRGRVIAAKLAGRPTPDIAEEFKVPKWAVQKWSRAARDELGRVRRSRATPKKAKAKKIPPLVMRKFALTPEGMVAIALLRSAAKKSDNPAAVPIIEAAIDHLEGILL
jgi:transposase-like protein